MFWLLPANVWFLLTSTLKIGIDFHLPDIHDWVDNAMFCISSPPDDSAKQIRTFAAMELSVLPDLGC